jgi:hypothetical protein
MTGQRVMMGDNGGDVLGGDTVQVQVDLWRPLESRAAARERLSRPHRTEVTLGGAAPGRLRCRRHATQAATAGNDQCS